MFEISPFHRFPCRIATTLIVLAGLGYTRIGFAHPMGNLAICHYSAIAAYKDKIMVRYVLDMAEIPAFAEKDVLDSNHDGKVTDEEKLAYLRLKAPELISRLKLNVDGKPVRLKVAAQNLTVSPGAGGLPTLKIILDLYSPLPRVAQRYNVDFADGNYAARTGWKEIIALAGPGIALQDSSVPVSDLSKELSTYPKGMAPLQVTAARFRAVASSATSTGSVMSQGPSTITTTSTIHPTTQRPNDPKDRDSFTEAILHAKLTPGLMLLGILIAFGAGALHALSPGHGKAMVAAYLVGSRGTARHAALLGMVVTITHTAGVFALGLVTLFLSQYVVPERLYPILSALSGAAVFGVGAWLLYTRLRGIGGHHHHHHDHSHHHHDHHDHSHDHHQHDYDHTHEHGTEYDYEHEHGHTHEHEDDHVHPHTHSHSHGGAHHHHHVPEGPVTLKTLIALGVSGGIVPCPSALIVLLAAVNLHRIAYGMLLITSFSLGLASVLVAIGVMVVSCRGLLDRVPSGGAMLKRLPVASAAAITVIGAVLVVKALQGTP